MKLSDLSKSTGKALAMNQLLDRSLRDLKSEIRNDRAGLDELEILLSTKMDGRAHCEAEIAKQLKIIEAIFSDAMAGIVSMETDKMKEYLEEQYKLAKERHADEMKRLARHFNYHPAYKRGIAKREFTGTYFTPPHKPNIN